MEPKVLRVFLSSPGDVATERLLAMDVIQRINCDPFLKSFIRLEVVAWDNPHASVPMLGTISPQDAVNLGLPLPEACDIMIVLLWTKLGTPLPFPGKMREDGSPFRSGTEWEYWNGANGWKRNGRPDILIYRCRRDCSHVEASVRQDAELESFLAELRSTHVGLNYYEDAMDLRLTMDHHLRTLLRRRIQSISDSHSHTSEDMANMLQLVEKYGDCKLVKGQLLPCRYHADRMEVELFEQSDGDSENNLDENTVEILPESSIMELFEKMQQKKDVAGYWGLMFGHRKWLQEQLRSFANASTDQNLNILCCGVAGYVHYLGYLRLVDEVFPDTSKNVGITVFDRCLTPIVTSERVVNLFAHDSVTPGASLNIMGKRLRFDYSIWQLGLDRIIKSRRFSQRFEVVDLLDEYSTATYKREFHVLTAHFLLSMWGQDIRANCLKFVENASKMLKSGGVLLMSTSKMHSPGFMSDNEMEALFTAHGFKLESCTRAWDVYDLSYNERASLLHERKPLKIQRSISLYCFRKC